MLPGHHKVPGLIPNRLIPRLMRRRLMRTGGSHGEVSSLRCRKFRVGPSLLKTFTSDNIPVLLINVSLWQTTHQSARGE